MSKHIKIAKIIDSFGLAAIFLGLVYCHYLVFFVVPNERFMGPVQRIFYFHVGSAIAAYASCATILFSGIYYLATRKKIADIIGQAAGEVGLLFCSVVMITGMIWGHSAWNTWFRWEPRLVTFLILWLILFSFVLLRAFGDPEKVPTHSAVLGIIGSFTVPLVVFSIKLLPQAAQLHPQVVGNRGLKDPSFEVAMFSCMAILVLLQFYLVWLRARLGILELHLEDRKDGN